MAMGPYKSWNAPLLFVGNTFVALVDVLLCLCSAVIVLTHASFGCRPCTRYDHVTQDLNLLIFRPVRALAPTNTCYIDTVRIALPSLMDLARQRSISTAMKRIIEVA